jgi:hypothetical protein
VGEEAFMGQIVAELWLRQGGADDLKRHHEEGERNELLYSRHSKH